MKRYVMIFLFIGLLSSAANSAFAQKGRQGDGPEGASMEMEEEEEMGTVGRSSVSKPNVQFSLKGNRDPMLSADDVLLLKHREKMRLAAEEAERKRRAEEEKKRLAEEERRRQWELMLIKDPTIVVRNQIRIDGLIDKEVLIGGKLYTVGNTYKGAKIVAVGPDSVTFSYKGHKFVKRINL